MQGMLVCWQAGCNEVDFALVKYCSDDVQIKCLVCGLSEAAGSF